jgi:hypothetical protein
VETQGLSWFMAISNTECPMPNDEMKTFDIRNSAFVIKTPTAY